ncbi:HYC_CC_PP family protein [Mucilaginibacter ginsenosidivorans]|uniref:Uncharacterized protein n=1 Tax=Mucilaginibacter ginsenosidivorans TaxID=398053 RepID=A0A5B8UTK4_9SPHI|nr:hypothetical protein [Mucilaginibacter ginsenosidivorans]QEC62055.1 hypothetical protein FRZ54_05435 [Mucilaginibacter ginsenosidivorans]
MKRTALILLTAVYLLSLVGIGVNRFYCCGKLASVTLIYGAADNAGEASAKKNNCCKHEKQSFKVKDSHVNTAAFEFSSPAPALLPTIIHWASVNPFKEQSTNTRYGANSPPVHPDIPFYTLNCTYLI